MAKIYYSVSPLVGDVKHDAVWVNDVIFEVTGDGESLIQTSRTRQNENELFFFLGETNHSPEDLEAILDRYPAKHQDYHVLSNNCWHFARWFIGQLGFDGWRLPNPDTFLQHWRLLKNYKAHPCTVCIHANAIYFWYFHMLPPIITVLFMLNTTRSEIDALFKNFVQSNCPLSRFINLTWWDQIIHRTTSTPTKLLLLFLLWRWIFVGYAVQKDV